MTIDIADQKKYLEQAAVLISKNVSIPGFRSGKVPYDNVKQKVGEHAILEAALEPMLTDFYADTIKKEGFVTIGSPKVSLKKTAPENPVEVVFTVSLLPKVTIGDYKKTTVRKKDVAVDEKDVDHKIGHLIKERAQEKPKDGSGEKGNVVYVDYTITLNGVPVEHGHAHDMPIELGDSHFIPGFEEEVYGLKKGDTKSFDLVFPKEYHNKQLAGKKVTFSITVKGVFELILPEMTDENVKKWFGVESFSLLRERITNHMKLEKERKQREKDEIDFFDEVIKNSSFEKIPEQMIDHELEKMIHELKMMLSQNGLAWNDFLLQENKKEEDFKKGFIPQAEKRAKVFLIIKEIANAEKISIKEEEIKNKINKDREAYQATLLRIKNDGSKEAAEAKKEIEQFLSMSNTEEYFRYLENAMRTDAVMEWIGKELIGW